MIGSSTELNHFISNAHISDFVVLFASTEKDEQGRNLLSCFLVDLDLPGVEVAKGYDCVSHRGYVNNILHFNDCKIPAKNILGEKDKGFELMNTWLEATRLTVAATSVARAKRAFDIALDWSANRKQFGKVIGKFQGVSFKLADMAMEIKLANLILMESAWKIDQETLTSQDAAMAKLFCTEMVGRVSDEAIQICGGMGLMSDIPLERIWRDARIERIWEGTSGNTTPYNFSLTIKNSWSLNIREFKKTFSSKKFSCCRGLLDRFCYSRKS